jgi:hypothetical protein
VVVELRLKEAMVREHAAKISFDVGALIPRPSPLDVLTAFRVM